MAIGLKCHQCFPHKEMPTVKQRLCHWSRMSHVLVTVTPGNAYSSWATAARGEYPAPSNNRNPWQRESIPHAWEKLWSFRLGVTETVNLTSGSLSVWYTVLQLPGPKWGTQWRLLVKARKELVGHTKSLADPNISAKGWRRSMWKDGVEESGTEFMLKPRWRPASIPRLSRSLYV